MRHFREGVAISKADTPLPKSAALTLADFDLPSRGRFRPRRCNDRAQQSVRSRSEIRPRVFLAAAIAGSGGFV
jgi:hypothetical protein